MDVVWAHPALLWRSETDSAFPARGGVCAHGCPVLSHKILTSLPSSQMASAFFFFFATLIFVGNLRKICMFLFVLICFLLQVSDFILSPPPASPNVMSVRITVGIKVPKCYLAAERTGNGRLPKNLSPCSHVFPCDPLSPKASALSLSVHGNFYKCRC